MYTDANTPAYMQYKARLRARALECSFCGKAQADVAVIICGPIVQICDECVSLCNDIIAENAAPIGQPVGQHIGHIPTLADTP